MKKSGEFRLVKYFFFLIFLEVLQCYQRLQILFFCLSGCVHIHIYVCMHTYVMCACVSLHTQNHLCAMQYIFHLEL